MPKSPPSFSAAFSWLQLLLGGGLAFAVTRIDSITSQGMAAIFLTAGCLIPAVGIWCGQRVHKPADSRPWLIFLGLTVSAAVAAIFRAIIFQGNPETSWEQVVYVGVLLPSYVLFTWAVIRILRVREHGRIRPIESVADSLLMAVAALLFMWAVIIDPILLSSDETVIAVALRGILPVLLAVTLFFIARTAMTFNKTPPALIFLCLGAVTTVVAHAFNSADIAPSFFSMVAGTPVL